MINDVKHEGLCLFRAYVAPNMRNKDRHNRKNIKIITPPKGYVFA